MSAVQWSESKLQAALARLLAKKDIRHRLKDGPWDEYIVVIYSAEMLLDAAEAAHGWRGTALIRPRRLIGPISRWTTCRRRATRSSVCSGERPSNETLQQTSARS